MAEKFTPDELVLFKALDDAFDAYCNANDGVDDIVLNVLTYMTVKALLFRYGDHKPSLDEAVVCFNKYLNELVEKRYKQYILDGEPLVETPEGLLH